MSLVMFPRICNRYEGTGRCKRKIVKKKCPGGRTLNNPCAPCVAGPNRRVLHIGTGNPRGGCSRSIQYEAKA